MPGRVHGQRGHQQRFAKRQQMQWTKRARTCCYRPERARSMGRFGRSSRMVSRFPQRQRPGPAAYAAAA